MSKAHSFNSYEWMILSKKSKYQTNEPHSFGYNGIAGSCKLIDGTQL